MREFHPLSIQVPIGPVPRPDPADTTFEFLHDFYDDAPVVFLDSVLESLVGYPGGKVRDLEMGQGVFGYHRLCDPGRGGEPPAFIETG